MLLKIALVISVVIQMVMAIVALGLLKRVRHNIAWWLISVSLLLMAIRRIFEVGHFFGLNITLYNEVTNSWIGVIVSLFMLISLFYIKQFFNIQERLDQIKTRNQQHTLSSIIQAEENERMRFSKELHDGLGPLLSSIKLSVSAIKKNSLEINKELLENTESLIDDSVRTVKEISNNLSPHILNNFGLDQAIQSFIKKLKIMESLDIQYDSNIKNLAFPYNIEVILYRVTTELVNNTIKHAYADNITIKIEYIDNAIFYCYSDNGKGFDVDGTEWAEKGWGIQNIISRIKSLKGEYDMSSKVDEGFMFNIILNEINTHE